MEIIDETSSNWLVQDDGDLRNIPKSKQNRALIDHGYWGLLQRGDEVLMLGAGTENQTTVTLTPNEDATEFTLQLDDVPPIVLGEHHKSEVVAALVDNETEPERIAALVELFHSVRDDMVREEVVGAFLDTGVFEHAEERDDGWFFHDHLLLTWECDLYHPNTNRFTRTGSVVKEGSGEAAYEIRTGITKEQNKTIEIDGREYLLTNKEMDFISKALWAETKAPKEIE